MKMVEVAHLYDYLFSKLLQSLIVRVFIILFQKNN